MKLLQNVPVRLKKHLPAVKARSGPSVQDNLTAHIKEFIGDKKELELQANPATRKEKKRLEQDISAPLLNQAALKLQHALIGKFNK
jgi:hypothetical protein